MSTNTESCREHDLVVWGATGFTGRLVAAYLYARYGAGGDLRWAMGGRSQSRLEAVRDGLGEGAADIPLLVGDSNDFNSLALIAGSTRVVCSTVGPFALHGSQMVAACVDKGTHYCDITGEVQWMRRMIDAHEERARQTGARIVHTCGFDSIPSDLGCQYLMELSAERLGRPCHSVKLLVRRMKGAFSGGTVASMLNAVVEARADAQARRALGNPYGLNPAGQQQGPDGPDQRTPAWDKDVNSWTAPFVMAAVNTRVVRRSNALMDYAYGRDFRYAESMMTGRGPAGLARAAAVTAAIGSFLAAASLGPARRLMDRFLLPEPGQGPSEKQREQGFFDLLLVGRPEPDSPETLRVRVRGDRDPGYGATSRMLGESAVCLARDAERLPVGGGFWTPASAMGEVLRERLQRNAGLSFSFE